MTPIALSAPTPTGLAVTSTQFPTNVAGYQASLVAATAGLTAAQTTLTADQAALTATPTDINLQNVVAAASAQVNTLTSQVTALTSQVAAATAGSSFLTSLLNGLGEFFAFPSGKTSANIILFTFGVDCNGNVNLQVITD